MFQIFYHATTRKYVSMFGNLFNDIHIRRFDRSNNTLQQIKVPITYSPKQKWFALMNKHPADTPAIAVQMPRIGFEISNFQPDPSRKINAIHKLVTVTDDKNKMITQFAPIPYKLNMELYVLAEHTDDGLQIAEQIFPYFNPDFNSTLNLIPGLDYKYDIRVNMTQGTPQDVYDGAFTERRALVWTFNFEIDAWYFGPVQNQGVIKRVQVDLHSLGGSGIITTEEMHSSGRSVRIVVKPGLTADGQPTTDPNLSIPYLEIDAEDDFGYIEETYQFFDGKRYDPIRGIDVPNE